MPGIIDPRITDLAAASLSNERNRIVRVTGLTNREFLEMYARAGRVGLSGGITLIDKAIARAQRSLDPEEHRGCWSHSFLFEGQRHDGHHWVIESDLQVHRKHIRLGVQENRISKYFDERLYSTLAVLDFGLSAAEVSVLLREGLDLVASRARYSLRELIGTFLALRHPNLRGRENVLARQCSMYCSAFVQHLFRKTGIDLAPGIAAKNTTPEDISHTTVPHTTYLLQRTELRGRLDKMRVRLRRRMRVRLKARGQR
jgi:hypothetical protein